MSFGRVYRTSFCPFWEKLGAKKFKKNTLRLSHPDPESFRDGDGISLYAKRVVLTCSDSDPAQRAGRNDSFFNFLVNPGFIE